MAASILLLSCSKSYLAILTSDEALYHLLSSRNASTAWEDEVLDSPHVDLYSYHLYGTADIWSYQQSAMSLLNLTQSH